MKFKAYLTDGGISLLEKRLLPALEKVGKTCHVYLTRDHAFLLHNLLQNDAVQCVAQLRRESLFSEYHISSNNADLIAFSADVSLLLRALRSASSISAGRLQLKLVKKLPRPPPPPPPSSPSSPRAPSPPSSKTSPSPNPSPGRSSRSSNPPSMPPRTSPAPSWASMAPSSPA